ncbi:MFS transporter [Shewanella colwelliana]|uniref:MFS transporter n=1 Tax=Shewanella colwelliana TaxID=23 RepID=UPI00048FD3C7|nr:MFS transporter [Shewanella colwelliana]
MEIAATNDTKNSTLTPVAGLSFFAVASGFLMSLIPLSLSSFGLELSLVSWLASVFYLGILCGTLTVESVVSRCGHRMALVAFLALLTLTIIGMLIWPNAGMWLAMRFIAGIAVAGVFVVVESWLLMADTAKARAKRLGLYMASLYGGSAIGQLAIAPLGVVGMLPYFSVMAFLILAMMPPLLIKRGQPVMIKHQKFNIHELSKLSKPAVLGCLVSGLLLGPIYGIMPSYISAKIGSPEQTGTLMATIILGGMLVQPLVSYLSTRMGKHLLMALFCLLGLVGIVGILESQTFALQSISYFTIGAASFALYPIAITLACETLPIAKIVSATEIMLLSYSVGSVVGPQLAVNLFDSPNQVILYLGFCFLTTCLYMLMSSSAKIHSGQNPIAG